jgi:hypothetical protein
MTKRQTESDDPSLTHKKPRKSPDTVLFEKICEHAKLVLDLLPDIESDINKYSQNAGPHLQTLRYWKIACTYGTKAVKDWTKDDLSMLDMRLPVDCECAFQSSEHQPLYM